MSTGSLVGSLFGGIVGFIATGFNPVGLLYGASLGAGLGMILDPIIPDIPSIGQPNTSEAPINTADFGGIVYDIVGLAPISGNIIWYEFDRIEEILREQGGYNNVVGYRYYYSWAIGICEGHVSDVRTLYKNDTPIWSGTLDEFYQGTNLILIDGFGAVFFYFGAPDQGYHTPSLDVIAQLKDTVRTPNRNICWAYFQKCYVGEQDQIPHMRFVVEKLPSCAFSPSDLYRSMNDGLGLPDYNPAFAIYYICTVKLGLSENLLSDESFLAAAETLYNEGRGISIVFNKAQPAKVYIEYILKHIEGSLVFKGDNKFHLVLIRNNYTVGSLPIIDETDILEEPSITRQSYIDTINEVKVQYTQRTIDDGAINTKIAIASPVAVDIANQEVQGKVVSKTFKFAMFSSDKNASWVGDNILLRSSRPQCSVEFVSNRNNFRLEPGDLFRLSYDKYNISEMVCRVLRIQEYDLEAEKLMIIASEESTNLSTNLDEDEYTEPVDHSVQLPSYDIEDLTDIDMVEAPYALNSTLPHMLPLIPKINISETGYNIYVSIDNGISYMLVDVSSSYSYHGTLVADYTNDTYIIDDTVGFEITFSEDIETNIQTTTRARLFDTHHLAILGDEFISFETITPVSGNTYKIENIFRGRYDTKKIAHTAGEDFYFIGENYYIHYNYLMYIGTTRLFKLVGYNNVNTGDISTATPLTRTISGRYLKPYTPDNFFANDMNASPTYTSDIVLTWSPRMRNQGAGFGDADNVTDSSPIWEGLFKIDVYVNDILVRQTLDINAMTWTYTNAMNVADNVSLASVVVFQISNYITDSGLNYYSDYEEVRVVKI